MLVRLLYASRALESIGAALTDAILAQSYARNAEHGITGILCAYQNGQVFIQALEGERDEVNQLYANIVRDSRHEKVTLLDYAEIDQRVFSGWRMGRVDLNRVNVATIMRYSAYPNLDPFSLNGRTALALMMELSTTTTVVGRPEAAR